MQAVERTGKAQAGYRRKSGIWPLLDAFVKGRVEGVSYLGCDYRPAENIRPHWRFKGRYAWNPENRARLARILARFAGELGGSFLAVRSRPAGRWLGLRNFTRCTAAALRLYAITRQHSDLPLVEERVVGFLTEGRRDVTALLLALVDYSYVGIAKYVLIVHTDRPFAFIFQGHRVFAVSLDGALIDSLAEYLIAHDVTILERG